MSYQKGLNYQKLLYICIIINKKHGNHINVLRHHHLYDVYNG